MVNSLIILADASGPTAFGLNVTFYVAAAMTALLLFAFFGVKVHKIAGAGLDSSIAEIRRQLDEARALRAEADALRKEYSDKIANAERDAAAMIEHAKQEADALIAKAQEDTTIVIARREKMASEKIEAAERTAVAELRAKAAGAAATAARGLIAQNHSAVADKVLIDQAIGSI